MHSTVNYTVHSLHGAHIWQVRVDAKCVYAGETTIAEVQFELEHPTP